MYLKQGESRSCGCLRAETARNQKYRDLTGQLFGRLTVIAEVEGKDNRAQWLCRCTCGAEKIKTSQALNTGNTRSCGCLREEAWANRRLDLTGETFDRWTVLSWDGDGQYVCRCSCGATRSVQARDLKSGKSKSCGCLGREIIGALKTEDLVGQTYNRLTVTTREGSSGEGKAQWRCLCTCGRETVVTSDRLKRGNTKSCGCLKDEISAANGRLRFNDLTGQTFDSWLVVARAPDRKHSRRWLCRCMECDAERVIFASVLARATAVRCECRRDRERFDKQAAAHLRSLGFEPNPRNESA
jgi:hypothetical protein